MRWIKKKKKKRIFKEMAFGGEIVGALEEGREITCRDTRGGTGFLQALLLNNEAGADEEAGRKCKYKTFDVIRGHALVPTGSLGGHG